MSTVAGPFSKRSTRALVSASSGASSARATPTPIRASAVTPARTVASLLIISMNGVSFRLEPVGELEDQGVIRLRVIAAIDPLVVTFKPQGVGDVVDVACRSPADPRAKAVVCCIVTGNQLEAVDHREIQFQPGQLVTGLDPPAAWRKRPVVGALDPGVDILAFDFDIRREVQCAVEHEGRPRLIVRVVPCAALAGDTEFHVRMGLPREEPADATARAGCAM